MQKSWWFLLQRIFFPPYAEIPSPSNLQHHKCLVLATLPRTCPFSSRSQTCQPLLMVFPIPRLPFSPQLTSQCPPAHWMVSMPQNSLFCVQPSIFYENSSLTCLSSPCSFPWLPHLTPDRSSLRAGLCLTHPCVPIASTRPGPQGWLTALCIWCHRCGWCPGGLWGASKRSSGQGSNMASWLRAVKSLF